MSGTRRGLTRWGCLIAVLLFATPGCSTRQPVEPARPLNSDEARYILRVKATDLRRVYVEADVPVSEGAILISGFPSQGALMIGEYKSWGQEEQWRDYVDALVVTAPDGRVLSTTRIGENSWDILDDLPGRVHLSYQIRLDHDQINWSPSDAEGTFVRDDTIFFRNWAVLIASPAVREAEIRFDLPAGWKITTTMEAGESASATFHARTRYDVLEGGCMLGTHETAHLQLGRIQLEVGVAPDVPDAIDMMIDAFEIALEEATAIFGAAPTAKYTIAAALHPSGTGSAGSVMANGMVTLFQRNPRNDVGGMWTYVLVHELLHMWAGGALRHRSSQDVQWFGEGFADYLSMVIGARTGVVSERIRMYHMGLMWGGYLAQAGERPLTTAGEEKSRFYNFLYGGGMHVGLLLDIEIRKATNDSRRIDDLMQALYQEFGVTAKDMDSRDVERVAGEVAGADLSWIFERFVRGTEALSPQLVYEPLGLVVTLPERGGSGRATLAVDPDAPEAARDLRKAILGID